MESTNNEVLKVNKKIGRTDGIDTISLKDIIQILFSYYKDYVKGVEKSDNSKILDKFDIEEYAKTVEKQAKIIAESIVKKVKERSISVRNIALSDDKLVKVLMTSAEQILKEEMQANIDKIVNEEGFDINTSIAGLVELIDNINSVDVEQAAAILAANSTYDFLRGA